MNESSGEVAGCWYCRWTVQLRLKIQKFDVVAEVRNGGGLGITVLAIGAAEAGASSRWLDKLEPLKFLDLVSVLPIEIRTESFPHMRGYTSRSMNTTQV